MDSAVEYLEIGRDALTEAQWQDYYHMVFEELPQAPRRTQAPDLPTFREQRHRMVKAVSIREFYIMQDGQPLGRFIYGTHNQGTPNETPYALFNIIHKDYQPETERFLAHLFSYLMVRSGHERVFITTWQRKNAELLSKWGATYQNELAMLELERGEMNIEQYKAWGDAQLLKSHGLYAVRASSLPDEWMDNYARLNQVLFEDMVRSRQGMPQENSTSFFRNLYRQASDSGQKWHHILLVDQDEQLAGFTLLVRVPEMPGILHQKMTVIRRDMRRKSLARWLKAAMALDMHTSYDEWRYIRTECYRENLPIIQLNESMGFRQVAEKQEFELSAEIIQDFLADKPAVQ